MTEYKSAPDQTFAVSSLIQAYRCPRRYYFSRHETIPTSDRYIICKHLSCSDPQNRDEEELWNEICLIHPEIDPTMQDFLWSCLESIKHTPFPAWTETDITIRSDRYGIHGLIDKYHAKDEYISITRASRAPEMGCWSDDRIRIAAYILCLQELSGRTWKGGYVEYIPDGIIRFCEPQPRDRRRLLQTLKVVRSVAKGELPGKPVNPPCKKCPYSQQCEPPKARTLSDIIFQKR